MYPDKYLRRKIKLPQKQTEMRYCSIIVGLRFILISRFFRIYIFKLIY